MDGNPTSEADRLLGGDSREHKRGARALSTTHNLSSRNVLCIIMYWYFEVPGTIYYIPGINLCLILGVELYRAVSCEIHFWKLICARTCF